MRFVLPVWLAILMVPSVALAAEVSPSVKGLAAVTFVLGFAGFAGTLVNLVHAERRTRLRILFANITLIAAVAALVFIVVSYFIERDAGRYVWYWVLPAITCVLWLLSSVVVVFSPVAAKRPTPRDDAAPGDHQSTT